MCILVRSAHEADEDDAKIEKKDKKDKKKDKKAKKANLLNRSQEPPGLLVQLLFLDLALMMNSSFNGPFFLLNATSGFLKAAKKLKKMEKKVAKKAPVKIAPSDTVDG